MSSQMLLQILNDLELQLLNDLPSLGIFGQRPEIFTVDGSTFSVTELMRSYFSTTKRKTLCFSVEMRGSLRVVEIRTSIQDIDTDEKGEKRSQLTTLQQVWCDRVNGYSFRS